jgi:regulator of sirC expression with transglutaminase-like and TPR domain
VLIRVEPIPLSEARRDAFVSLLDDSTPAVRQALLREFAQLGKPAMQFLQEIARGRHRVLGWHAHWFLAELKFTDPVAEFRDFIRSLNFELETGSLLLSRTVFPDLDAGACCLMLDGLAARCRELIAEPATPRDQCRVINRVLFHEYGFRGNREHYADPLNSFLDQVLARRKGIPISLCIVYQLVAQRLGLQLEPVALPGHFLVGCYVDDAPFFIDPFAAGCFRTAAEVCALLRENNIVPQLADLAPTPVREVLCRCCRNLVSHYLAANESGLARLFAGFVGEFEATCESRTPP